MPSVQERDGRFQLRVKHKLLPKPYFSTFETRDEAEQYGDQLKRLLKSGIVPQALASESRETPSPLLSAVTKSYRKLAPLTKSDDLLLNIIERETAGMRVAGVAADWADGYVRRLKTEENNAPGTIRKKVGLLARVIDWHIRRSIQPGEALPSNPLRSLPRGYSGYSKEDAAALGEGKKVKRDVVRDRRLLDGEAARIVAILEGVPAREAGKWRIPPKPELKMLFELIVDSGLRLSEAYALRSDHLELDKGFTRVDGSKGHREVIKPRTVPLKPALVAKLRAYSEGRIGLLFPFWNGDPAHKKIATRDLVQLFKRTFKYAKVAELTEHDLRHEACCRWFELRGRDGRWMFSDVEICKIMGWSNYSMVLRYASLRGEDLASRFAA